MSYPGFGTYTPFTGTSITSPQKAAVIVLIEAFRSVLPPRPSLTQGKKDVVPNAFPEFDEIKPGILEQINNELDLLEAGINAST